MHASCTTRHRFDINDADKSCVLMNITLWFKGQSFCFYYFGSYWFKKKKKNPQKKNQKKKSELIRLIS